MSAGEGGGTERRGRRRRARRRAAEPAGAVQDSREDGPGGPAVDIYTDGACSGNPGPGGWGAVMRAGGREKELSGGEALTTNNRMELTAAIEGLGALTRPARVRLHTDSTYLRDGITKWIARWRRNGWRTASRQPVKNADLWERLDAARAAHEIEWCWVKGHAGHRENERADELARAGMAPFRRGGGARDPRAR